jgi:predicted transcriptional regulator
MVNAIECINPLRKWREDMDLSVERCAYLVGVSANCWYQYERYPAAKSRSPSPKVWLLIREFTDQQVTPNHFSDLLRDIT